MDRAEIEAALQSAFVQCELNLCPLSEGQQQIVRLALLAAFSGETASLLGEESQDNPLDELDPQQRQALLAFITAHEKREIPWKIKLLNDWLGDRNSGEVQFIRDIYGLSWLNRVRKVHLAKYLDPGDASSSLRLKVGDRIEVCNGLWEWVQDDGPCSREWFPCQVVGIRELAEGELNYTSCIIRFESGLEYEIQGIYQWNRYNWRFPQEETP
ncbi:MAG: hypothetical protein HC890_01830 [Chloroflexaceae bacterium]|nr:hypothetical protein [Chloroflexaceae bacterium]